MMNVKEIKHVTVLLLVNEHGEFLLGKRRANSFAAGFYELPGGKQERNESLLQTVRREIREETGYKLDTAAILYETEVKYKFGVIPLHVFYAKLVTNNVPCEVLDKSSDLTRPQFSAYEAEELVWVTASTALTLPLLPILRRMLDTQAFRSVLPPFGKVDTSVDRNVLL